MYPSIRDSKFALGYFIIAAFFGVLLRSFIWLEIPINYKFIIHTHSHIALLGWVYVALTTLLNKIFIQQSIQNKKYRKIFWFTQLTLIGMLLSFPFQGYALFSILFSTLFLFASYWYTWFFIKYTPDTLKKTYAYKCMQAALWYLVISSLGPWVLGVIMNTLGADSVWYRLAIYFYLHFTYNGWMIMALVGLFFYVIEQGQIHIENEVFKRFFWIFNLGIILSFLLSTLFADPSILYNVLGGVGALLQLIAFGILLKVCINSRAAIGTLFTSFQNQLLKTIMVLWGIKMGLQLLTAIPYFANLAATILDFTIGYLHWTFLGVITLGLFLFFDYFRLLRLTKTSYYMYLTGFVLTEILIFFRGIAAWYDITLSQEYIKLLAIGSFLIPISLLIVFGSNLVKDVKKK